MASKSSFSSKEWELIKDSPDWVYAALAAADGREALVTKISESRGFSKALKGYKTNSQLIKDVIADDSKPAKAIKNATLSSAEEALQQIGTILDKKSDPDDAEAFREFLMSIGQTVAEAAGEKIFGLGDDVSKHESKALEKIAKALKATDEDKKVRLEVAREAAEAMKNKQDAEAKRKADAERQKKEAEVKKEMEAARKKQEAEARRKADAERKEKEAKKKAEEKAKAERQKAEVEARRQERLKQKEQEAKAEQQKAEVEARRQERLAKQAKEAEAAKYIGEHTVVSGDSLSAIAKQYYGSMEKAKWMAIYEANKDVIGDNPNLIKPGQVFKIPKLSD